MELMSTLIKASSLSMVATLPLLATHMVASKPRVLSLVVVLLTLLSLPLVVLTMASVMKVVQLPSTGVPSHPAATTALLLSLKVSHIAMVQTTILQEP